MGTRYRGQASHEDRKKKKADIARSNENVKGVLCFFYDKLLNFACLLIQYVLVDILFLFKGIFLC